MRVWRSILAAAITCSTTAIAGATEPNETFATATVLPGGVLTAVDSLTAGVAGEPDTLLGIRGLFGDIEFVDDDSSPVGNGLASGVGGAPTNSGSIDFAVTGVGDDFFEGSHGESGSYEVFVDVYDFGEELIDSFSEIRTLEPGAVHEYSFNDFEWLGGSYDVYIDNVIFAGSDVDFFTFSGLTPGGPFTATTFDPDNAELDTILGWFDESGAQLDFNDDIDPGNLLSKIEGTIPANGMLTFAVSGFGDDDFQGSHGEAGPYELRLTATPSFSADFNNDGSVNAADLAVWRGALGVSGNANGDADNDNDSDGADFLIWQQQRGSGPMGLASVPEPSAGALLVIALVSHGIGPLRRRNR